jgi:murein DD-endopeptidase MepM/ murein hydrolase activator NlpD
MHLLPLPRVILPLLLLALITLVPVSASAQTQGDVDSAKSAEEQAFQALLDADEVLESNLEEMERIQGQIFDLEWRIEKLETALAEYAENEESLEDRAKLIVLEAYTTGGRNMVTAAFSANDIQDLITTQALFDAATTRDLSQLDQLSAVGRQVDRLNDDLVIREQEVQGLRAEQEVVIANLEQERAAADKLHADAKQNYADVYQEYKAEQARRAAAKAAAKAAAVKAAAEAAVAKAAAEAAASTKASTQSSSSASSDSSSSASSSSSDSSSSSSDSSSDSSSSSSESSSDSSSSSSDSSSSSSDSSSSSSGSQPASSGVVCPLPNGSSFIDTWGYSRAAGRTHKGTDMIASRGSTIVAMVGGSIRMNWHSLGGRQVYVNGTDGVTYYYAHLSGYPSGLSSGQTVSQGQVIGYVGSTGNATTNVLHLGMIIGGTYVNPYATVRAAC